MGFNLALALVWAVIILAVVFVNLTENYFEDKGGYSINSGKIDLSWFVGILSVIVAIAVFVSSYT
ncbi:hypothetical protein OAT15_03695 [Gammaproteobacteria bacterium]|nr:hypothetical protein [Gammaproteobacteria bacterium]